MSIIKNITKELENIVKQAGYEVENLVLQPSGRKDLGQYQINDAMPLAKKYGKAPRMIAEDIAKVLEQDSRFTNINIAGPGFINITLTDEGKTIVKDLKKHFNSLFSGVIDRLGVEQSNLLLELLDKVNIYFNEWYGSSK